MKANLEKFETDYFQILKDQLESKFNQDIEYVKSKEQAFEENNFDKIYTLSSIKDSNINNLKLKIKNLNDELEKEKAFNELLKLDGQITDQQLKEKNEYLEKEFNNKQGKIIENLNEKIKMYEIKMDEIIKNKTLKLKKKNENKKNKTKLLEDKINEKKQVSVKRIENKQNLLLELSNKLNDKKIQKIQKNKMYKEWNKVQEEYDSKKIGNIFYEKNKKEFEPKLMEVKTKIDEKTTNFELQKYKAQMKFANLFGAQNKQNTKNFLLNVFNESKLLILILGIAIFAGISNNNFFTQRTWINILTNNLDLLMIAFGMTLIILTGGIDLSVGSILAFAGSCMIKFLEKGVDPWIAMLACVVISVAFGVLSGFLISYVKLQPFIVTLVLMLTLRGGASLLLESKATLLPADTLQFVTRLKFWILPFSFWFVLCIFIGLLIIMRGYKYGRYIYAVGGNIKAAYLSGIRSKLIVMSVYMFSNALVAMGTIIYVSKLSSISPTSGNQIELDAIACVALGGTSLIGGKGGVGRTLVGWFVISVLQTSMNMVGFNTYYQMIVKGSVILIAVLSDKQINISKKISKKLKNLIYKI
ncbi:ribose transport system permease protein [Spiroplasma chinense]|uniref:Ribose transport system permease protein n=1 Tax=Spiroplasma chinense TaxID=216932 RepID=A0A5B9Y328_9MOLU|nr:ABC transporter permease [Spiroplasma chinense]QEH61474.1 ribose transport system permease protein [Spiroplasma chinense]